MPMLIRSWMAWLTLGAVGLGVGPGCGDSSAPLGLPDGYVVYAPLSSGAGAGPAAGPTLVAPAPLDDAATAPLHKLLAVGFTAEVLRTTYLVKQFVREANVGGVTCSPAARHLADEPTLFVVGPALPDLGLGLAIKESWSLPWRGPLARPTLPWVGVPAAMAQDSALSQTIVGRLGRHIARALATAGAADRGAVPDVLVNGYAQSLEVIAREWRMGEGPQDALAFDAGTAAQRDLFAAVRANRFGVGADGKSPRPAAELLRDPGLVATVLYRFAQAKVVGRRVAPPELYAPFVTQRIPAGISPAAVLGPFRNFQAKLIAVWGRAVLRGKPPADIVDLVEAYAAELPAERAEAIRLFVVTTLGATVKPGGVTVGLSGTDGRPGDVLPELTALAAEVAAGRRSLRAALESPPPAK